MLQVISYPERSQWAKLITRPELDNSSILKSAKSILTDVRERGDSSLLDYTEKYDGYRPDKLLMPTETLADAVNQISPELKAAIAIAEDNIRHFHKAQREAVMPIETMPGVRCWRKSIPIRRVGLYIPGGTAPLFSSLLMLGLPAKIAGCAELVLCTPPDKNGAVHPAIRYIAAKLGVREMYTVGGAQAIAAMAYGTGSIRKVDKIFGPGNRYVTAAKQLVQEAGVAIDMPAGPSEVLVIADALSNPDFVAADLLSQAEHGADSQVMLVVIDAAGDAGSFIESVQLALKAQLNMLPRKDIAARAMENSYIFRFRNETEAMDFSNAYAPEHLIISTKHAISLSEKVTQAGSVFIGKYACESAGDYASGTNHTLPTNGYARSYSGVSLDSFLKKVTFQEISEKGLRNIGQAVEIMAEAEGLYAHKNAISIRLKSIDHD
ncbi:MAG TPA: histidinol dehydrogenase [Cryomorphaceae bacterium]|nr:histidinol dehydrogenase [Cryomorphaceae bacterium]